MFKSQASINVWTGPWLSVDFEKQLWFVVDHYAMDEFGHTL